MADRDPMSTLEDPLAAIEELSASIAEMRSSPRPPALRIDITDPPSPAFASIDVLSVSGADADSAIRALGRETARRARAAGRRGVV